MQSGPSPGSFPACTNKDELGIQFTYLYIQGSLHEFTLLSREMQSYGDGGLAYGENLKPKPGFHFLKIRVTFSHVHFRLINILKLNSRNRSISSSSDRIPLWRIGSIIPIHPVKHYTKHPNPKSRKKYNNKLAWERDSDKKGAASSRGFSLIIKTSWRRRA